MEIKLARLLFNYHVTPHTTTGASPAELLMGRRIRTHLDMRHPNLTDLVKQKQAQQKLDHDKNAKSRVPERGNPVYVRDLPVDQKWLPGSIERCLGYHFKVSLLRGFSMCRHNDHMWIYANELIKDEVMIG